MNKISCARRCTVEVTEAYRRLSNYGGMDGVPAAGMNKISEKQLAQVEKQYKVYESMIQSMTAKERKQPELLVKSPSRR